MSSLMPSLKYSCSASPLMLANGSTQTDSAAASSRRPGRGSRAALAQQRLDAAHHLAPGGRVRIARPAGQVGALDLVERHRQPHAVDAELDQLAVLPRPVRLGADPLGLHRLGRPDHHDRLGRRQPLLDDVAVTAMRRQLVVAPDAIAERPQRVGDPARLRLRRPGVRNEDVRHPAPLTCARLRRLRGCGKAAPPELAFPAARGLCSRHGGARRPRGKVTRMEFLKDRRVIALVGAGVALVLGVAVAWAIFSHSRAPVGPPPASQGGLVVVSGRDDDAKLDPKRPLRCFVGGQFVGELPLAVCAQRNGVATGALDVGLDPSGALAAATNGARAADAAGRAGPAAVAAGHRDRPLWRDQCGAARGARRRRDRPGLLALAGRRLAQAADAARLAGLRSLGVRRPLPGSRRDLLWPLGGPDAAADRRAHRSLAGQPRFLEPDRSLAALRERCGVTGASRAL